MLLTQISVQASSSHASAHTATKMATKTAARGNTLDLTGYQDAQGAITVAHAGDFADPYFALRALLTAHAAGLDIAQPARAWIDWMLPRQEANGLFKRYCQKTPGAWHSCAEADADDALLALWLELLYVMAPDRGLPPAWKKSARLAQQQLQLLLEKKTGIYLIAGNNRVGLLMDNVEIYAALRSISYQQKRLHATAAALATLAQAVHLRVNITRVFRPSGRGLFRISTQAPEATRFYPEDVAQIFPWLYRMPVQHPDAHTGFKAWLQAHGKDWLALKKDEYPWGLVALTAQQLGDVATATCWSQQVAPLRHGERWNVLEEAVLQAIRPAVAGQKTQHATCEGRPAS